MTESVFDEALQSPKTTRRDRLRVYLTAGGAVATVALVGGLVVATGTSHAQQRAVPVTQVAPAAAGSTQVAPVVGTVAGHTLSFLPSELASLSGGFSGCSTPNTATTSCWQQPRTPQQYAAGASDTGVVLSVTPGTDLSTWLNAGKRFDHPSVSQTAVNGKAGVLVQSTYGTINLVWQIDGGHLAMERATNLPLTEVEQLAAGVR